MLTTNHGDQLNVLITRPTTKSQALAESLATVNIACVQQPLFDYQPLADYQTSEKLLVNSDIIIFVSVAAVEFSQLTFASQNWRYQHIIAVGKATKTALQLSGINPVICPKQENSEGLLALGELSKDLNHKSVTIVRGDGGREHLAQQLITAGATVNYLESYQRIWRTFAKDISKQWLKQQINCIVVTSNALLEKLVALTINNHEQHSVDYWQNECTWLVASQRIGDKATQLGLTKVVISDGASAQAITAKLRQIETNQQRKNIYP